MSFNLDDTNVGGQLKCGTGIFPAIGEGVTRINGSAGIEGPMVVGSPTHFPTPFAGTNIGPLTNSDGAFCFAPGSLPLGLSNPYSLMVSPNCGVLGNLDVNFRLQVGGPIFGLSVADFRGNVLAAKKDFDIPHPTKGGWRLRHVCLEGPEAGVYIRGRLTDSNTIEVPDYWDGLVDPETITVQLTQIGCSQDLIVDKIEWGKKIVIKSGNASKIDCYYYVQAERKDGEKLIAEYEGTSIEDYPGDNSQYTHNK